MNNEANGADIDNDIVLNVNILIYGTASALRARMARAIATVLDSDAAEQVAQNAEFEDALLGGVTDETLGHLADVIRFEGGRWLPEETALALGVR